MNAKEGKFYTFSLNINYEPIDVFPETSGLQTSEIESDLLDFINCEYIEPGKFTKGKVTFFDEGIIHIDYSIWYGSFSEEKRTVLKDRIIIDTTCPIKYFFFDICKPVSICVYENTTSGLSESEEENIVSQLLYNRRIIVSEGAHGKITLLSNEIGRDKEVKLEFDFVEKYDDWNYPERWEKFETIEYVNVALSRYQESVLKPQERTGRKKTYSFKLNLFGGVESIDTGTSGMTKEQIIEDLACFVEWSWIKTDQLTIGTVTRIKNKILLDYRLCNYRDDINDMKKWKRYKEEIDLDFE